VIARRTAAAEAHAIGLLQQIAVLCDETRRHAASDPARIGQALEAFEETLASLAPVLESLGNSPVESLDAVRSAAHHAAGSHQALLDAMSLELDRLGRAIAESDTAAHASVAYAAQPAAPRIQGFEARG
jgi:hypothetical protein